MNFCKKRYFKRLRRIILKEMIKLLESPNEYIKSLDSLQLLYYRFLDDETQEVDKKVEGYLQTKGLPTLLDIQGILKMRQQIQEDNETVLRVVDKIEEIDVKVSDLQEYVILQVNEMKNLRNQVQKKLRCLQQLTVSDSKRIRQNRNIN